MKKMMYLLVLALVVGGIAFGFARFTDRSRAALDHKSKTQTAAKSVRVAERKTMSDARKKWEASPDGIAYKAWEVSPEGKKVQASYEKIAKDLKAFTDMEAVVTSVTFQRANTKSPGPKWLIVSIHGDEYMMQFSPKDFRQLEGLKVNDQITIRSRSASCSPNHPYLILSGDYIAQDSKVLFKRDFTKNKGC